MKIAQVLLLISIGAYVWSAAPPPVSAQDQIEWRIAPARFGENEPIVYGCSVRDFGAAGDGRTDDSPAFQKALDAQGKARGGVVFVPEGYYALHAPLNVPPGVTLRGEWSDPSENADARVQGAVLQIHAGRGQTEGPAFFSLQSSSGLKHLNIWHPEQNHEKIVPYPFAIEQANGDNATVQGVTLVNAYQGVRITARFNELHYVSRVRGTPLSLGLLMDGTTDIGRLEDIHFSPRYWSDSGLPGAPKESKDKKAFGDYLKKEATAIRMLRSDWEYSSFVTIDGYRVGLEVANSKRGAPNAQFYGWRVTDCAQALYIENCNNIGLAFTRCEFQGTNHAALAGDAFTARVQFHDCQFRGPVASHGVGSFSFQHCRFESGGLLVAGGSLAAIDCDFLDPKQGVEIGEYVKAATLQANRFAPGSPGARDKSLWADVQIDHAPQHFDPLPTLDNPKPPRLAPEKQNLILATRPEFGARADGKTNDAPAIQKALDHAAAQGGGIVFLPGGDYNCESPLTVPSGVQLRGAREVPHHTMALGTMLHVSAGKGDEDAPAFITLKEKSGLRGVTIHYPEQQVAQPVTYPFTIRGRGADIVLIDVTASNPYRYIDLASERCDGHYLDYVAGAPMREGIRLGGGSRGGVVRDTQFNPHYWSRLPLPGVRDASRDLWTYQKIQTEAFLIGDVRDELLLENFVFGARHGIRFIDENGQAASGVVVLGHGTDGSTVAARVDRTAPLGVDFINAELVCLIAEQKIYIQVGETAKASARFFNTLFWGEVDTALLAESGDLLVQQANFLRHGRLGLETRGEARLRLVNAFFHENQATLVLQSPTARAQTLGNISQEGLSIRGPASPAERVEARGDIRLRLPLAPDANTIYTRLEKRPVNKGVTFTTADGESRNQPTVRKDRAGWTSVEESETRPVRYMYFTVAHPGFIRGAAPRVEIRLRYFDEGRGAIRVVYDSNDLSVRVGAARGAWKEAGRFDLGDTRQWRDATFAVHDARFDHQCNGKDIRIEIDGAAQLVVSELLIKKKE